MLDGEKIKARLSDVGLSSARLAEVVGVSKGMMSFIINGKRDTTVTVACRIAKTLDCGLEELLEKGEKIW